MYDGFSALLTRSWPAGGTCWEITRQDMVAPDWFLDPLSGRRAPQAEYCFSINHRNETVTGNVKQVWELSRHHHLTLLAAAYALTGDRRYAERAGSHLRSWWQENPFLSGIHWTSGIELGNPADLMGLDPSAARRLGATSRACSIRTSWPASKSGGTRPTCPGSVAAARQPTTMSSPRRPGSLLPRWRSLGSRRAPPGLTSRPACSSRSSPTIHSPAE